MSISGQRVRSFVSAVAGCFLCASCAGNSIVPHSNLVPLRDAITENRRALASSSDQIFFETLVKFHELGPTFSLYAIEAAEVEVDTTTESTDTGELDAGIKQLGAKKTLQVHAGDTGKLTIHLAPITDDKKVYNAVADVLRESGTDLYATTEDENDKKCVPDRFCFGYMSTEGKRTFAYLVDVRKFRRLEGRIAKIEPSPKKAKGDDSKDGKK